MPLEKPKISALLPVYNAANTLLECLEHLNSQTVQDFELIVVLNGCSDESKDIISNFAFSFSDLKIFELPSANLVNALNYGLEQCSSDLIARVDADDFCHPERFQKQYEFLIENPSYGVCGTQIERTDQRIVHKPINDEEIRFYLLFQNCIVHPSVMFNRKQMKILCYDNTNYGDYGDTPFPEDYILWMENIDSCKFKNLPDSLLVYHQHPGQITRKQESIFKESFKAIRNSLFAKQTECANSELLGCLDYINQPVRLQNSEKWLHTNRLFAHIYILGRRFKGLRIDLWERLVQAKWDAFLVENIHMCRWGDLFWVLRIREYQLTWAFVNLCFKVSIKYFIRA